MKCALCGKPGASDGHAVHGIICHSCYEKQPPLCDFCSAPSVRWRYEAESFLVDSIPGSKSVEDWAACDECHEIIEDGDYPRLALRSLKTYEDSDPGRTPLSDTHRGQMIEAVRAMHAQFRTSRKGPAKKEVV